MAARSGFCLLALGVSFAVGCSSDSDPSGGGRDRDRLGRTTERRGWNECADDRDHAGCGGQRPDRMHRDLEQRRRDLEQTSKFTDSIE